MKQLNTHSILGTDIRDNDVTIEINGVEHDKPSNRSVVVSEVGIFYGQYEFVNNNWIVTNKSLNQMLFK